MEVAKPASKGGINKWAVRIAGTLVFVAILVYAIATGKIDFSKLGTILLNANWWLISLSILMVFPFIAVKSTRWQAILHSYGVQISWWQSWRIYAIALGAGQFTPGQAGDVVKAWYIKRMGYPLSTGLLSMVVDRLYDIAFLGIITLEGVLVFSREFGNQLPLVLLMLAGALVGIIAVSIRPVRERLIGMVVKRFSKGDAEKASPLAGEVGGGASIERILAGGQRALLIASIFTVFSFVVSISRVWLCAEAVGVHLDIAQAIGINALTTAAALIPISVGGMGTRDAVLVGLLALLGYSSEQAIALSTLILLLNLVNVIVGYAVWLRNPARIDEAEVQAAVS